eukprot:COSAG01_NODE_510_length_16076_cov_102.088252_5_plen_79_part_00
MRRDVLIPHISMAVRLQADFFLDGVFFGGIVKEGWGLCWSVVGVGGECRGIEAGYLHVLVTTLLGHTRLQQENAPFLS